MTSTPDLSAQSPFQRLAQWWRDLTAPPLATAVGSDEAVKIASDVRMTVSELEAVRHMGKAAAYPMYKRLASLGLNEEQIARDEPGVLNDLQRVCSLCAEKKQCVHELRADPGDTHWQEYCPNMSTFEALEAEALAKAADQPGDKPKV